MKQARVRTRFFINSTTIMEDCSIDDETSAPIVTANSEKFPSKAPLWDERDFVPGRIQTKHHFWENTILKDHPDKNRLLNWIQGVRLEEFVDSSTSGLFHGNYYNGSELTSVELANHIPPQFEEWASEELLQLEQKGCIAKWSQLADVSESPRPKMCLPLGVEPKKPRLFWDGRWLNLMCKHSPFQMDGVGKVAQCSWQGAHQVTLDHKSGFHNVPLHPDSWTYFGFCWQGVYYVWTVLCFGWCSSPFIYHGLSDAIAQYIRSLGVPILTWLDDFWLSNRRDSQHDTSAEQAKAAHESLCLALTIFYRCGYFMSLKKCSLQPTTRLIFLGVVCDTALRRFEVPESKLTKLELLLNGALQDGWISFPNLEKLAGKCTSMSVAVPPASLYTYHMYKQIAQFQRTGGSSLFAKIKVTANSGLRSEMELWLDVRARMNGASWYDAAHHALSISGATDASSTGWGGVVRGPSGSVEVFRAAADFPTEWLRSHINVKETFALYEVLRLLVEAHPDFLRASTVTMDVDNKTMFHSVQKGRAKNERMHDLVCKLFWLQVDSDFTLKLRWIPSGENSEADGLTRPDSWEHVRLHQSGFNELWVAWGGFDMDLMASTASAQRPPSPQGMSGQALPFYSRFHTKGTAGVDVFTQDVGRMPDKESPCFGFCFPPPSMVGILVSHLQACHARAVLIVPDTRASWFPLMARATIRWRSVAAKGDPNIFFRMHHQHGPVPFVFHKWGMRAVEVDFK